LIEGADYILGFADEMSQAPIRVGGACMAKDRPGNTGRIKENSKLFIKCANANWELFTEQTETHDISESGISFYLKTPVWVDSHLTIIIASSTLFGRLCSVSAKVVRVQVDATGRQLVAARFDD